MKTNNYLYVKIDKKSKDFDLIQLIGDMDKTGLESVREEIDKLVEETGKKHVVLDCGELNFVNSEGIGYILTMHYRLLKKESELVMTTVNEHVRDVFDVIGVFNMVHYFDTTAKFKDSLK